jgi:hypothetical protein
VSGWLSKAAFPLALASEKTHAKTQFNNASENASRNARENTGKNTSIVVRKNDSKMTAKT